MNPFHMFGAVAVFAFVFAGVALAQTDVLVIDGTSVGASPSTATITTVASPEVITGKGVVGQAFILDGSKSQDDGVVQRFLWKQVSGPAVSILNAASVKASVTPQTAGTYVFELSVTDATGKMTTAQKHEYVFQNNQTDLDFLSKPAGTTETTKESGEKGGTEDINIGVGELQETASGFMKLGDIKGESTDEKKGNVEVEWKVEEGESAESASNDRLVNAGPKDDWPTGGISVASGDVKGLTEEQKQERLEAVKDWAEVKSGQDLQNFAAGVLLKDVQIKGSKILQNAIEVDYKMPAKLFGFIPVQYTARVSVNKGDNENWDFGRVKVKFPWYSFLLRKGTSANELTHVVQQGGAVEAADSPFSSAAKTMTLLSNIMKTKHDTVKNSISNVR